MPLPFKHLFATAPLRQSLVTSVSTVINGGLGAVFYLLLARFIGAGEYGAFSAIAALVTMLSSVFDLGTSQGLVKFSGVFRNVPRQIDGILTLAFLVKLLMGTTAVILFMIFAPFFSEFIFRQPQLVPFMRLAGIGILASMLFSFVYSLAQARQKFYLWGGLFVGTNALRLLLIIILLALSRLTGYSSIVVHFTLPLLGFLIGWWFLRPRISTVDVTPGLIRQFFSFNKWITATVIVSAIGARIDTLLTARFLDLNSVGVYALATQMIVILPQLTTAFGAVTVPRFSSFTSSSDAGRYLKKVLLMSNVMAISASLLIIPVAWLVLQFAGKTYSGAWTPFLILLAGLALFFGLSPLRDCIQYFFGKPQYFFWQGAGAIILTVILSLMLIPPLGITGSALVVLFVHIAMAIVSISYYLYLSSRVRA